MFPVAATTDCDIDQVQALFYHNSQKWSKAPLLPLMIVRCLNV